MTIAFVTRIAVALFVFIGGVTLEMMQTKTVAEPHTGTIAERDRVTSKTGFNPNCGQCNGIFKINGQDLYLEKIGDRGPSVVFEAGLGNGASTWKSIYKDVSKFAQVVLYDRAGIGKSSPRTVKQNSPITADEVATSLNLLLKEANIKPPYILVGHSLGGLYVQMFARKYPNEVVGAILLDSASPYEPEGVFVTSSQLAAGSTAYFEEAGTSRSNWQVRNAGPFPNIPLVVLTATNHGSPDREKDAWWMELQRELAAASLQGQHLIAEGSGHYIQDERPALVIDTIKAMIRKLQRIEVPGYH